MGLEECLINMELLFGMFVFVILIDNGGIVWMGDWECVSMLVIIILRSLIVVGVCEMVYMVFVLGVVGVVVWVGVVMV